MTNQLLLAQVLAEGFSWDYLWHWTHDDGLAKTLVTAVIAGFVSLCVAWWNDRRADKQMDFSKRSKPPELARYKELLEISKAYKDLVNYENVDALAIVSPEYREIEESRKIALERLSWEYKVLSDCRNIQARKKLLKIPESYIVGQWMGDLRSLPNFNNFASLMWQVILYIFMAFISIKSVVYCKDLVDVSLSIIRDSGNIPYNSRYLIALFPIATVILSLISIILIRITYVVTKILGIVVSVGEVARYEYIKMLKKHAPKNIYENLNQIISSPGRNIVRMRYAMVDEEYVKLVNVPDFWRENNWLIPIAKILSITIPYALLEKFNKSGKPYGSYLDGVFEIDAKNHEDKEPSTQDKAASDKKGKN